MKKKICIFLITIIIIFLLICFSIRIKFNSYINNNIKYEDNINKTTSINLSISSDDNDSSVKYRVQKSNGVYKINYDQYENDKHNVSIEKYYINDNKIYEYTYNNGKWIKNKVSKVDKIFNIDYKRLKKNLMNINYKGSNDKYKKYTAKMYAYDAYNFIYSKNILTSKDNKNIVDVDIYIDKSNNMIYKLECVIPNITSIKGNIKSDYKFEVINTNINNVDAITLPFKK